MNAFSDIAGLRVTSEAAPSAEVCVNETFWGYVVTHFAYRRQVAAVMEAMSTGLGMALMLGAGALWLWPGSTNGSEVLVLKLGATLAQLAFGWSFLNLGRRGVFFEVQVDLSRRELRTVTRNRYGRAYVIEQIRFSDVGSVFLQRGAQHDAPARLMVRYRDTQRVVELACGEVDVVENLMMRIRQDIRPTKHVDAPRVSLRESLMQF